MKEVKGEEEEGIGREANEKRGSKNWRKETKEKTQTKIRIRKGKKFDKKGRKKKGDDNYERRRKIWKMRRKRKKQ